MKIDHKNEIKEINIKLNTKMKECETFNDEVLSLKSSLKDTLARCEVEKSTWEEK
jgi:hypothetical protein